MPRTPVPRRQHEIRRPDDAGVRAVRERQRPHARMRGRRDQQRDDEGSRARAHVSRYSGAGAVWSWPPVDPSTLRAVFDALADKLQNALGDLRGRGTLDEETISRAMREVRLALLEADVNFEVVKEFVAQRARARARRGRAEEPDAGPAGREDRPRRADRADGLGHVADRVRAAAADDDPARGPPGLGQDDDRGQARAAAAEGRQEAGARRRRPAAPGRDRAADPARRAGRRPRVRGRAQRSGQGGARRHRARAARTAATSSSSTPRAACTSTRR